jgi:hypothetical protein
MTYTWKGAAENPTDVKGARVFVTVDRTWLF